MKLYNNDFKAAMKGYKAVKTVCKSANFVVGDGEIIVQSDDVEVSFLIDSSSESDILLDECTLKQLEKVNDDFEITLNEVKAGTKTITYSCEDKAKPLFNYSDFKEVAKIPQQELLKCIKGTKFSTAKDDVRPILQNILWQYDHFITTDGNRVTTKKAVVNTEVPILIIPTAFNLLEKLLDKTSKDVVTVLLDMEDTDTRYIAFEFEDKTIITRVGTGEFFNWEQVFTDDYKIEYEVDRKLLIEKLEFLQQDKNPVILNTGSTKIVLKTETLSNSLKDEIEVECISYQDSSAMNIAFNTKYLIESLKNILDDEIKLTFVGGYLSPLIIKHTQGKDLLLPIKLSK